MLTSSAVDHGLSRTVLAKDYKIGICCFSAKQAVLRRKSKDWLAQNRDNVSEWSNMSTWVLLFHVVQSEPHYHLIKWKLFLPQYG
jgi:hypothetical protein